MLELPREVVFLVIVQLDLKSVWSLKAVCKTLSSILTREEVFHHKAKRLRLRFQVRRFLAFKCLEAHLLDFSWQRDASQFDSQDGLRLLASRAFQTMTFPKPCPLRLQIADRLCPSTLAMHAISVCHSLLFPCYMVICC